MTNKHQPESAGQKLADQVQVIRHNQVCQKLGISSAKLFDMVAKKQFLKPFTLIPGGRAVGFLERDVNQWILERKAASEQEVA
jgi:predicted DNA-binding transcriptional regulator AlpA